MPEHLAAEITEDLQSALEELQAITDDLLTAIVHKLVGSSSGRQE